MPQYESNSEKQTKRIAREIARTLKGGDIVLLEGELGAGKTVFVQGLAKALGISDPITSPTFTLMNVYRLPKPIQDIEQLVHIDTYRLENKQQLFDIGLTDYAGAKEMLTVIEWPEKVGSLLNGFTTIKVKIEQADKKSSRQIFLTA